MKKIYLMLVITMSCLFTTFATGRALIFDELFDKVSRIDRFEVMDFNGGDMGFPDNIGKGIMAIHPNAESREEIIALLEQLPHEYLVYDNTDERGRFDRFFKEGDSTLLYVHVGQGSGDTVVILFKGGKTEDVKDFISRINKDLSESSFEE